MKILQLTKKFPYPLKDGESKAIFNLTKAFYGLGHDVTLLGMSTPKHPFKTKFLPEQIESVADFHVVEVDTGVKVPELLKSTFSGKSYNIERFISERYKKRLKKLLQKEDFDIVQLEGLYLAPYIPIIKKYSSAKIAMRSHNLEYEIWERLSAHADSWLKRRAFNHLASRLKGFELKMINEYDAIVPISPRDAMIYKKSGCTARMHIAPASVDFGEFQQDFSQLEFPSLFFIGALDWMPNRKGLDWFIKEAWPPLQRKFPELKFYIAGRNTPASLYSGRAGIQTLGEIDNAADFMNSKAIMVVPLLSGSGMRIKIIEAMALGKAIVSTSIGAEGIQYTPDKEIMIADTPEAFVEKISSCIEDKKSYIQLCERSLELAKEKYEYISVAKALLDFYQQKLLNLPAGKAGGAER